jgi:uncharacterized protein YndB with AHSA1/START domain
MLKKILLGFVALVALLVAIAYVLPREVHVERSITIDAPPSAVYAKVSDFNKFNEWSPWFELDPNTEYTFTGEPGKGQAMTWKSTKEEVGSGKQTIVDTKTDERVDLELDFGEHGLAKSSIILVGKDGKTDVTWTFESDMGMNPIGRWMGLMMDGFIGPDYDRGLAKLKSVVEGKG